jgi:acetyl-CoA carboxylase carboxyl transferase subunit alpha
MANPDGYRKAIRLMVMAGRFGVPILSLIDTPGAYPGIGAEERGQAEAIAHNLREMASLPVPLVVVITGEGGSGGALAIAMGDTVMMLENSIYSVISPEGCASILWRDRTRNVQAADSLRIAAQDLIDLGVVDEILPEPPGGAHRDPRAMAQGLKKALKRQFERLAKLDPDELLRRRRAKFRGMGVYEEG